MKFFFLSLNDSAPIPILSLPFLALLTYLLPFRSLGLSSTKSDERAEARRGIRENRNSFFQKKRRTSIEAEKKELLKTLFCFKAIHSFLVRTSIRLAERGESLSGGADE